MGGGDVCSHQLCNQHTTTNILRSLLQYLTSDKSSTALSRRSLYFILLAKQQIEFLRVQKIQKSDTIRILTTATRSLNFPLIDLVRIPNALSYVDGHLICKHFARHGECRVNDFRFSDNGLIFMGPLIQRVIVFAVVLSTLF